MDEKEILLRLEKITSKKPSNWLERAKDRQLSRSHIWVSRSTSIALKVLRILRAKSLTQKDLADGLNVSPQYINRILKGKENLTLDTICKLEDILGEHLITVQPYHSDIEFVEDFSTIMKFSAVKVNISSITINSGEGFAVYSDEENNTLAA